MYLYTCMPELVHETTYREAYTWVKTIHWDPGCVIFFWLFGGWVCFRFVKNYIQPDPFVPLALSNYQSESRLFGMVILYWKNSLGFLGGQNGSSYQRNYICHMTGGINIHNPAISRPSVHRFTNFQQAWGRQKLVLSKLIRGPLPFPGHGQFHSWTFWLHSLWRFYEDQVWWNQMLKNVGKKPSWAQVSWLLKSSIASGKWYLTEPLFFFQWHRCLQVHPSMWLVTMVGLRVTNDLHLHYLALSCGGFFFHVFFFPQGHHCDIQIIVYRCL